MSARKASGRVTHCPSTLLADSHGCGPFNTRSRTHAYRRTPLLARRRAGREKNEGNLFHRATYGTYTRNASRRNDLPPGFSRMRATGTKAERPDAKSIHVHPSCTLKRSAARRLARLENGERRTVPHRSRAWTHYDIGYWVSGRWIDMGNRGNTVGRYFFKQCIFQAQH